MTLRLTQFKEDAIFELRAKALSSPRMIIRSLSRLRGKFTSSFIAVPLVKLYYRGLERHKTEMLKFHKGNFDKTVALSAEAKEDIMWWKNNIKGSLAPISRKNPDLTMTTDTSLKGWG